MWPAKTLTVSLNRVKSEVRAWDHVEIGFVTKTKMKNY